MLQRVACPPDQADALELVAISRADRVRAHLRGDRPRHRECGHDIHKQRQAYLQISTAAQAFIPNLSRENFFGEDSSANGR